MSKTSRKFDRIRAYCGAIIIALVICEIIVRSLGATSEDGEFSIYGIYARPYNFPIADLTRTVRAYELGETPSRYIYDQNLGWVPRPNGSFADGLYVYNSQSLRANAEYAAKPGPEILRIAVFGDSCTEGGEVPLEDTWAVGLERYLNERGIKAEVLNFGVSGYGIDQALLRWENYGVTFSPHIVVLGFHPENMKRNLNIIRPLYVHSGKGVPFSKPRFVLAGNDLRLLNSPTMRPNDIIKTLLDVQNWELRQHEFFYDAWNYQEHFWLKSRLFGVLESIITTSNKYVHARLEKFFYDPQSESGRLALKIISRFHNSVQGAGAEFLVLHLPRRNHLYQTKVKGISPQRAMLDGIIKVSTVVEPDAALLKAAADEELTSLYAGPGLLHPSPFANKINGEILGEVIARYSERLLASR